MRSEQHAGPQASRLIRPILKQPPPAKTGMFSSIFSAVSREFESFVENVRGVDPSSRVQAEEPRHYEVPPRSSENAWSGRSVGRQPKPKPYSRPSPKKGLGSSAKKRKVPGAFFSSPMSAAPTPLTSRYPHTQDIQFSAKLGAITESSRTVEPEESQDDGSGEEEGEDEEEEANEEGDGEEGRHVRFAPNTRSPIARRPVRSSLKQSAEETYQDTPAPVKKSGKKSKLKSSLLGKGQQGKDKGKSKASVEQIALWEKETEERAWGRVGGSTIASLEEELLGAEARLEAEKERILLEGGELSESDEDEDGQDESFEVVLHPRPPRGTPYVRSNQVPQSQSLPDLDESMRRYRRRTAPVDDTPVPKKHGTRPRVAGPSLGRAPPPILPTVAKEPAAEKLVVEEPVAEEPVAEEPVAEEPVVEEPTPVELEPPRHASPPPVRADSVLMDISPQKQQPKRFSARLQLLRSQSKPPSPTRSQPREAPTARRAGTEQPATNPNFEPEDTQAEATPQPTRRTARTPSTPSPVQTRASQVETKMMKKEVEFTVISDDSDEDDEPTTNDEPNLVEPSKRPILQDTATSRKSVPPQRSATPKLSLMTEASRCATQPPEEVDPASIPLPASPEDKRRIRELEAEVRRLREELAKKDQVPPAVSSSAAPPAPPPPPPPPPPPAPPPPPPMGNRPTLPIVVARRRQEEGEWDGELDEDGEGPRSDLDRALCMMRAGLKATAQTPAAGPKISTGKTPTVPMESMTAFLEEMKTVKLKSRVGPTPKASAIKVKVEEDDGDDDVGNNTFAFRRQRGPPISPRALRATSSLNSNGSSSGTLSFPVKLRKTDSGAALFGERPKRPSISGVNASAPFSLPGAKRKRPEAEPQTAIQSTVRRRLNVSGAGSVSVDATTERELPTPSLCSDTTELEVEERALRTPPAESRQSGPTKESTSQAGVKSEGGSTSKPGAATSSKANILPADISKNAPSRQKAVPDTVEKPRSKSKPTSPVEDTRPAPGDKPPSASRDQSVPVPEDTSIAPGNKTMAIPGEKSIRAAASKVGAGRRRFVPVFAVPPPPPTTSATTPAPSAAETSTGSAHSESSSSKTRDRPNVDTNVRASTPARKTSLSKITPSSPLPRPDFSAKKPRAPRLLTPQRREVIVIDDSDEESPKSASSRRARRRPGPNDSDSDDPLAFTSTPARGSKTTRSTQPEWDIDPGVMQDLSFRSLFPNSDDEELESDVYTGVGTQSKTGGFLKGGGAGGRAVWAGAGTVSGADEPVDKSGSISRRR
ncbi:unnamed protein product [Rhizoctonia solani]|uniref:Uncharacterized protein n=1 Tax=Rhizoctonia solani TaxID=456999 RepID=A0A8H3CWY6_9AGAM|nr:unnamed protein product [Rhizoctonia solani]